MPASIVMTSFFMALGIGWRLLSPQGISGAALQRALMALAHLVILPVAIFFILSKLPMNAGALRILWYVLATSAVSLAVAWFWLQNTTLAPKTKGALLIAAGFGNVLFLGLPLNKVLIGDWSMRIAAEYGLIANVVLLFTAGAILSRSFGEPARTRFQGPLNAVLQDRAVWLKEPLVWAALAGLLVNITGMNLPAWFGAIEAATYGFLIPLLLLSTALSVSWNDGWKTQLVTVLPVAGIKLILVPLVMWAVISLFGSLGAKTTQALVLDSMMPATLLGFLACDRYKLDTQAYALAFSLTSVLAVITVPIWFNLLF